MVLSRDIPFNPSVLPSQGTRPSSSWALGCPRRASDAARWAPWNTRRCRPGPAWSRTCLDGKKMKGRNHEKPTKNGCHWLEFWDGKTRMGMGWLSKLEYETQHFMGISCCFSWGYHLAKNVMYDLGFVSVWSGGQPHFWRWDNPGRLKPMASRRVYRLGIELPQERMGLGIDQQVFSCGSPRRLRTGLKFAFPRNRFIKYHQILYSSNRFSKKWIPIYLK